MPLRKPTQFSPAAAIAMGRTFIKLGQQRRDVAMIKQGKRLLAKTMTELAANRAAELAKKAFPPNDG